MFAPVADRCQFCGLPQPWAADRRAAAERSSTLLWNPDDPEVHDPAKRLYSVPGRGGLYVIEGDIIRLAVEALVSNDDVDGQMWAETARAIRNAAGEEIEQRAQDGKPYKLGEAWVTPAGDLGSSQKNIIHVAAMNRHGESDVGVVIDCLNSILDVARREGYESIGLSAFGSGPNAIDKYEWYRVFARTIVSHLTGDAAPTEPDSPEIAIVLVLFEPQDFMNAHRYLSEAVTGVFGELGRPSWGLLGPAP